MWSPFRAGAGLRILFSTRRGGSPVRVLAALLALILVLPMTLTDAQARSPDRPVILLGCPGGADPLCQAMIQALARAAAGPQVIRRVAQSAATPTRPGDLGVSVHVARAQGGALSVHLEWQTTPNGPRQTGPARRMEEPATAQAPANPQAYDRFTHDLLRATPALHAALTAS